MVRLYDVTPVEFGSTSGYRCSSPDLYFEHDRDLEVWRLTCLDDGSWDVPAVWPSCVPSKYNSNSHCMYAICYCKRKFPLTLSVRLSVSLMVRWLVYLSVVISEKWI